MNEVIVKSQEANAMLSLIERMVLEPSADIDKLQKLLDMQERVMERNAKQEFSASMAEMQAELPRIAEGGKGHNSAKYALLEDINEAIKPILHRHGFAVSFRPTQEDKGVRVTAILSHRAGHSEETSMVFPHDTSGSKNPIQAVGSAISYGKRYTICALLNISTGDDIDGGDTGLAETIEDIKAAADIASLQATFKAAWNCFTDTKSRADLTAAKDTRKKELQDG